MTKQELIKRKIVADLKAINPKKIIVFGSFTSGKFIKGRSDIDLLVVKETKQSLAERYKQARLALTLHYPFDIFILTARELKDRLANSFFFREIVEKGEVIYEKH